MACSATSSPTRYISRYAGRRAHAAAGAHAAAALRPTLATTSSPARFAGLQVFDKDFLGMGDDRLGTARIPLDELESGAIIDLSAIPLREATSGTVSLTAKFMPDEP